METRTPEQPTRRPAVRVTRSRQRPSAAEIAAATAMLEPWEWLTSPKFYGWEHVPTDRPIFLVGNHTLMGVLDVPLLVFALFRRGIFARPLGDHMHFRIPLWRDLLSRFGTVDGTRENCRRLMRAGESLLVFPGGGREVFKRKGEKYQLLWKNRIGFARLAVEFGYPIVPFAAVGAEECYEIVIDGNDLLNTPLGGVIERLSPRPDVIPPLVRGIGLSPLPRPQRFYFRFGAPIETAHLAGRHNDEAVCFALREEIRAVVQRGIKFLLAARRRDPERALAPRLLHRLSIAGPGARNHDAPAARRRLRHAQRPRTREVVPARHEAAPHE